jgi:Uma2 family endonuclease
MTIQNRGTELSSLDLLELRRQAPDYVPPPPPPVSWEAFHDWLDEDTRAEWVDGVVIEMPPATDEHQVILGFLYRLFMSVVERHDLGVVYLAPFLMKLPTRPSGREPDLLFVSTAHADRLARTWIQGPADLVVEIVSRDSVRRDHREKLAEYEAAGVPEYWVIDPLRETADFYLLGEDGRYRPGRVDAAGIYTSREVPGLRVRVSWLWQWPLPKLEVALADLPEAPVDA